MTKDVLLKMCGGLSAEEKTATLNELGITDTALVAEVMALTPVAAGVLVQPPVINPAAAVQAQPAALPTGNAENLANNPAYAALQAQLDTEKAARITAECGAFFAANANKVTPAEATEAKKVYAQLAGLADHTALNSYTASIQARPVNPMLQETVAASGAVVLGNGAADTRTEDEKEAALVTNILAMTPTGRESAEALKTGSVPVKGLVKAGGEMMQPVNLTAALKQFAVGSELITK